MIEYISNLFKVKTLKYKIREENPGANPFKKKFQIYFQSNL